MFGLVRQRRRRQTHKSAAAAEAAYAESGSAGLPGALLSQQVLDRVLDPDALVHPLGIVCNTDTGGETPQTVGEQFEPFPTNI